MRVLIVGAGAQGGMIGARLTESGQDVTLLEINQARAKLLNEQGLVICETGHEDRCIRVRVVTSLAGLDPVDLVFVSVKSYQTEAAVQGAALVIAPHTRVLSMQNGVGNIEVMARLLDPQKVLGSISYHSVQHIGPNRLRYHRGIKPILIAPCTGGLTPDVQQIAAIFIKAGLQAEATDSIDNATWQKLLHNAVVNPVSALTGLNCDQLLADEDLQLLMRKLCMEMIAVMRARGVPIDDQEDPYRPVIRSQQALGENRPSMWQDLSRQVRTEVDAINGAVVKEAERLGLEAPLHWALVRLVHSAEHGKGNYNKELIN